MAYGLPLTAEAPLQLRSEHKYMPMMPPDADLKTHLANRRSLAQARAAYLAACTGARSSQDPAHDSPARKDIAAPRIGIPAR